MNRRLIVTSLLFATMLRNRWEVVRAVIHEDDYQLCGTRFRWNVQIALPSDGRAVTVLGNTDQEKVCVGTWNPRHLLRLSNYDLQMFWDAPGRTYIEVKDLEQKEGQK